MVSSTNIIFAAVIGLGALEGVLGHVSLAKPIPRGSWNNPKYPVDYNLEAPLNNAQFPGDLPCRHKQRGPVMATYRAGQSINVNFKFINKHKGGHCQFGLSYDNENFVVLKTVFGNCFDVDSYTVPLPAGTKGGDAVFSWSWVNAEGNREYYNNCADIHIDGPSNGSVTGQIVMVANMPNTPFIDQWIYGKGTDGHEFYKQCPVITIPSGAQARADGRVNDRY